MIDHGEYPFGSSQWSDAASMESAGLFGPEGIPIGYHEDRALKLASDAPMLTCGGAGSGKTVNLITALCQSTAQPLWVLDPRGEIAASIIHNFVRHGAYAWCFNPVGLHPHILPSHRCNPLDILRLESPRFHADVQFITEALIPASGGSESRYFEQRAQEWLGSLIKARVEQNGFVSFPDLYRTINAIESDAERWRAQLEFMLASSMDTVRRTAGEMLAKQQDSPKEFGSILGEIYAHTRWLDNPTLQASLEHADFSLEALCDEARVNSLFVNVPIEYVHIWAPLLRVLFTVTLLYKIRRPQARRITMVIDECGQLGNAASVLQAVTYGRGAGVRAWPVFQDIGQIVRNFGAPALQGFIGSSQLRQFFGIRDYQTAQLVSDMLGTKTLSVDDALQQGEARWRRWDATRRFMDGGDPFAAFDQGHFEWASQQRRKQSRPLMTPAELLAMPERDQVLFISGLDLNPLYAQKLPFYTRRELNGFWLPNPHHDDQSGVLLPTLWGPRRARVIEEPLPPGLESYPQYQTPSGLWRYVEGHRPI